MKKIMLLAVACTCFFATAALAYQASYTKMDVATVLAEGKDDQHIVMEGKLTRHLHKDKYIFEDRRGGSMTVEVDDDCVVHLDKSIRAYGEIEVKHGQVEVEIERIELK